MRLATIILLGLLLLVGASVALAATAPVEEDNSQLSPKNEEIVEASGESGEIETRMDAVDMTWSNIKSLWN